MMNIFNKLKTGLLLGGMVAGTFIGFYEYAKNFEKKHKK